MVADIIRDSTVGQFLNFISNGRLLPYQEQHPDFVIPAHFLPSSTPSTPGWDASDAATLCGDAVQKKSGTSTPATVLAREDTIVVDEKELSMKLNNETSDPNLVSWYGDDDPDNPRNWSPAKRAFVAFSIRYGIGPMFLSPMQELPVLGRNIIYMASFFLFVIFQIPIVTATNIQTILAFRFLTGFFGSPALATGGASMGDIYPANQLAYVVGIWAIGAVGGPIAGPVIGGFAAQAKGWRWPQYELIWLSAFSFGEKDTEGESIGSIFKEALLRPFILAKEPVLMFANVYLGFVYAIFYLWFEAFPLVFTDIYNFNLGISGLPFLGFFVSAAATYTFYVLYQKLHIEPRADRATAAGKSLAPEVRLEIGLIASLFIPTSLLIFGFGSRENVHWIVPIIGASLYLPGIYLNFQSILMYVTSAYPLYAASVLAGNDLFRSSIASVFPLFGRAFFTNLGLGPASALLAGVSLLMMPVFWSLMKWGHLLRSRSKYAQSP
ncbi:MFS general substrate transporter [Gymnopus androsaceus JB14]|uniref:MFS general substrate transporter n=1 Tax=Gymnopus androsaceus JB14 TaxID=1447944 RepID=A0A6A4H143_9AGAR|nr:MFS general substrate transporter [Gymnopus androsaceus JB14]